MKRHKCCRKFLFYVGQEFLWFYVLNFSLKEPVLMGIMHRKMSVYLFTASYPLGTGGKAAVA